MINNQKNSRLRIKSRIPVLIDRIQPSQTTVLIITAIVIGMGTGLGAVLFIRLIELVNRGLFSGGEALVGNAIGRWLFILIPAFGGLMAGPIISYFASEAKGHGVPEVMTAIALRGGRIRPRVVLAKIAASALCIGSGGSAGREGPIVQVGAALGSTIGQWLHLSELRIRNLVACGAAAGIAATFNAPIAGVVFSMEIILGELHLGDLGNVIISSVTASTLARVFLGDNPAFSIPRYAMHTPWEVLLYVILGVISALTAIFFIKILYWFEDLFDGWKFPSALKPAIGGLLLGVVGVGYPLVLKWFNVPANELGLSSPLSENLPHIFGSGFSVIEDALLGKLSFGLLFALVFLKPLATSLTLGSGNSGGVFAPALFIGASLGGTFGKLIENIAPGLTAGPGAFATIGMASVFAGAARAPFTAILIVFEMTDDYRLIVPLMTGVIVSMIVAERLHKESIYTLKLSRRGIRLHWGRVIDVMDSVRVEEIMMTPPGAVHEDMPITLLANEFIKTGRHGFPVIDHQGNLSGMVSVRDYQRAFELPDALDNKLTVGDIATRHLVTIYPDEPVSTALRRMAPRDLSRLPVVDRTEPHRLLGTVRRNDIVRAYELGVIRREDAQRRASVASKVNDANAEFIEVQIAPRSSAVGKMVGELELPRSIVLVSIRRGRHLVIPHGDTLLEIGDVITALCKSDSVEVARLILNNQHDK